MKIIDRLKLFVAAKEIAELKHLKVEVERLKSKLGIIDTGRKLLSSDFSFQPDIGIDCAWLFFQSVQIPVVGNRTCEVILQETEGRQALSIVKAMRTKSTFEAILYEGTPKRYSSMQKLSCQFVTANSDRSWADSDSIVTIKAVLTITTQD